MKMQLTLALRYLAGRKLRTVLTTLAIMFGVLVLFGVNSLTPSLQQAFQVGAHAAAGEVDATITLKTSGEFDAAVRDQVAAVEGVSAVSGSLNRAINVPTDYFDQDAQTTDSITIVSLVGINVSEASTLHSYSVKEGRFLQDSDSQGAVISEALADVLGVAPGDSFTLPVATGEATLSVVGVLPTRLVAGNEEIYVTLGTAQAMLAKAGEINIIEAGFTSIEAADRANIENDIVNALGDNFHIGTLSSNSTFINNLKLGSAIFNAFGVLALLMGGFIIFNTFRTVVAERRRDIGMLRTLGANRATIIGIVLSEGLLQGLIGTSLGLLLGYWLANILVSGLSSYLGTFINAQVGGPVISLGLLLTSIGVGLGITLLAGFLPALAASKVTPLEAMRPEVGSVTIKRMAGFGFWSGVVLIAAAIAALLTQNVSLIGVGGLVFIVGLFLVTPALVIPLANLLSALLAMIYARSGTAQLAESNLSRQPSRAAITAGTTLISLAIIVMMAALISSVEIGFTQVMEKSLSADYLVLPPSVALWDSNVGASPDLGDSLRSVEGVDAVTTFRFAPTLVDGAVAEVMGIDPATFDQASGLQFTEGNENTAYEELSQGRNIIVNGILASATGITVNDQVDLVTPSGTHSYRVIAIATDYFNSKLATVTMSQANLAADFNVEADIMFLINVTDSNKAAAETGLKAKLAAYPQFRLVDGQAYIQENLALFQSALAGMVVIAAFLAVPSLIAMVNTLAIGVIERTREIGMLRAIGATRKQIRAMILAEALILSGIGAVFGILAGMYLGYLSVEAMAAAGFPAAYVFPASGILLAIAAGIVFGLLAAIIPARQASKLQVIEALRYE